MTVMVQQINLFDVSLRPRKERGRAVHAAWAVGATVAASMLLATGLDHWTAKRNEESRRIEQQSTSERQLLSRNGGSNRGDAMRVRVADLDRLRTLEAGQRRVHALLDAQVTGRGQGYTPYFLALSRQASTQLWITGFGVAADDDALEIQGRMSDASALPGYLRHLNAEPQFRGRSFEQLNMKAAESSASAAVAYTEFTLRSRPQSSTVAEASR